MIVKENCYMLIYDKYVESCMRAKGWSGVTAKPTTYYYPSHTSLAQLIGGQAGLVYKEAVWEARCKGMCFSQMHTFAYQAKGAPLILLTVPDTRHISVSYMLLVFPDHPHVRIFSLLSLLSALCTSITAINVHEEVLITNYFWDSENSCIMYM